MNHVRHKIFPSITKEKFDGCLRRRQVTFLCSLHANFANFAIRKYVC